MDTPTGQPCMCGGAGLGARATSLATGGKRARTWPGVSWFSSKSARTASMSVESSAQAAEPTRGLAERFPFIATPATNPALPLLPPEGPEQKPDVRHERDRCVSAWVEAATIEGAEPLPVGTGRLGGTTGDGGVVLAADTPMQLAQHARNWRGAGRRPLEHVGRASVVLRVRGRGAGDRKRGGAIARWVATGTIVSSPSAHRPSAPAIVDALGRLLPVSECQS